ncbi:hypothetical protein IE53DRAFT_369994 [Violaceomyces palustris]|uniref:Uncharacterized protein n=1 Tax=Violaceomyces palustris TaxID=1673888 RepID=A0ACD0NTM1_9BASI|nr:hypothetical protein IE53DRAFT_369994 [Violaceomyces palustris]
MPAKKATSKARSASKRSTKRLSVDQENSDPDSRQSRPLDPMPESEIVGSSGTLASNQQPLQPPARPSQKSAPRADESPALTSSDEAESAKGRSARNQTKKQGLLPSFSNVLTPTKRNQNLTTSSNNSAVYDHGQGKGMLTEEQIQAFLDNYDLETSNRLARLRGQLEVSVQSARARMNLAINKIPRAVRKLKLSEFVDEYGAEVHAFMGRAPADNMEEGRREWEQFKEGKSPVKGKRSKKSDENLGDDQDGRTGKSARVTSKSSASSSKDGGKEEERSKGQSRTGKSRASSQSKRRAMQGQEVDLLPLSSPITSDAVHSGQASWSKKTAPPSSSSSSSSRPPSSSTFAPHLPHALPPTPAGGKPRVARVGERIQWKSLNGSPIVGVIGPDGFARPIQTTTANSPGDPEDEGFNPLVLPPLSSAMGKRTTSSGLLQDEDNDVDDDNELPDEEEYTARILAAEALRRSRTNGSSRTTAKQRTNKTTSSSSSSPSIPFPNEKVRHNKKRASIVLGSGTEIDLATASPGDLEGLSPDSKVKAREAVRRFYESMRSKWD